MERDYPMEREMEEKMRHQAKMHAEAKAYGQGQVGADLGATPVRESLSGRFRSRLNQAQQESRKAEQLNELLYLLDKHPEIARILDLVEAVGTY